MKRFWVPFRGAFGHPRGVLTRSGALQGVKNNVLKTTSILGPLFESKRGSKRGSLLGDFFSWRALVGQSVANAVQKLPDHKYNPLLGSVGLHFEMLSTLLPALGNRPLARLSSLFRFVCFHRLLRWHWALHAVNQGCCEASRAWSLP